MLPNIATILCCGQSSIGSSSTIARKTLPVPIANTFGVSDFKWRCISAAPACASPTVDDGSEGSLGTTSHDAKPNRLFNFSAKSIHLAMG